MVTPKPGKLLVELSWFRGIVGQGSEYVDIRYGEVKLLVYAVETVGSSSARCR